MMKEDKKSITALRATRFGSIIRSEGHITRGDLLCKLGCSEQTLAREYMGWLQIFKDIFYDKKKREFRVLG